MFEEGGMLFLSRVNPSQVPRPSCEQHSELGNLTRSTLVRWVGEPDLPTWSSLRLVGCTPSRQWDPKWHQQNESRLFHKKSSSKSGYDHSLWWWIGDPRVGSSDETTSINVWRRNAGGGRGGVDPDQPCQGRLSKFFKAGLTPAFQQVSQVTHGGCPNLVLISEKESDSLHKASGWF